MKFLKPILVALLLLPLALIAPLVVLLVLPFIKWDGSPTFDSNNEVLIIRGDLPEWASWLSTPDERLPGGTYEPAVMEMLTKRGPYVCSWYWLGIRNTWQGLAASFGVPVLSPWPPEPGYYESGSLWWLRYPLFGNRLQLKAGYRTYGVKGQWLAVPCLTITKA